ncbi:MAG: Hpt domain-containing protein [Pseudomonadota bacterium]
MIDWVRVKNLKEEIGPEDFDEVLELFFSEVEEVIGRLGEAEAPGTVAQNLHFLKGAALNLGFAELSEHCHNGEIEARDSSATVLGYGEVLKVYAASKQRFITELPQIDAL